jgi:hypothetical protein
MKRSKPQNPTLMLKSLKAKVACLVWIITRHHPLLASFPRMSGEATIVGMFDHSEGEVDRYFLEPSSLASGKGGDVHA